LFLVFQRVREQLVGRGLVALVQAKRDGDGISYREEAFDGGRDATRELVTNSVLARPRAAQAIVDRLEALARKHAG